MRPSHVVALATSVLAMGCGGSSSDKVTNHFNPLDKIYFAAPGADGANHYFTMNEDGSGVQLVSALSSVSPNDTVLSYISPDGSTGYLYTNTDVNTQTFSVVNLATGASLYKVSGPSFSTFYGPDYTDLGSFQAILNPAKTTVYYSGLMTMFDDPHQVHKMNLDGTSNSVIWTCATGYAATVAAVSPDDATLLVVESRVTSTTFTRQLRLVSTVDGSSIKLIPMGSTYDYGYKISSDGKKLLFVRSGTSSSSLIPCISNLDGTNLVQGKPVPFKFYFYGGAAQIADFSDGLKMIFASLDSLGVNQVYSTDMSGNNLKQLTNNAQGSGLLNTRTAAKNQIRIEAR